MTSNALRGAIGAIAIVLTGCAAPPETPAQNRPADRARTPAEFPPASFEGRHYVDSAGCAFIRTGSSGAVTWVPRVSRAGIPICDARPSLPRANSDA